MPPRRKPVKPTDRALPARPGDIAETTIERIVPGGLGLGYGGGRTLFVTRAAVGDVLKVKIDRDQGRVAHASIVEVLTPGPARIDPPFPRLADCGADFQHLTYEAQLTAKQEIIADCMRRIAGIDLLDTGDFYGTGHNEELIGKAIRGRRDSAVISLKFGAPRDPDGALVGFDARPAAVKNALAYSLRRLGTDHVDIYRPARVDPTVPIEDTVGAIADLIRAGHVRHLGLSEAGAATLRRAHAVHPVTDLQIEYSLMSRGIEAAILPACRELGVTPNNLGVLLHRARRQLRAAMAPHWTGGAPLLA